MKKQILFSDGTSKEMSFEEARKHFLPMVIRAMKRANNRFLYNAVEEEDFQQELEIELWRAYRDYDSTTGNCFTTYLHYKLQKGVRNATYSRYSLKHQHQGLISMNAPIGEDELKLEDILETETNDYDEITLQELIALIKDNVSEEDQDTLECMLNKKDFSVQDFADKYGITRQAANQKIVKLRKKLSEIVKKEYLGI